MLLLLLLPQLLKQQFFAEVFDNTDIAIAAVAIVGAVVVVAVVVVVVLRFRLVSESLHCVRLENKSKNGERDSFRLQIFWQILAFLHPLAAWHGCAVVSTVILGNLGSNPSPGRLSIQL